jgi:hypothetical protein
LKALTEGAVLSGSTVNEGLVTHWSFFGHLDVAGLPFLIIL